MTLYLQNPECCNGLVKSASITFDSGHNIYWLSVHTKYTYKSDYFKSILGAKITFGRVFGTGGKWSTEWKADV